MSFMFVSVVSLALVSCLSPAKLLKLSGFVLISPHSFCFFPVYAPHFFLFSKRGNSTHNTHNIYNFVENQALDSQQTHNKTPTRSQHLTTLPQETRKCCELLWVVVAFFIKITPPLTFSSSEPLVENVVNVVSVVSRFCILRKNRFRITWLPIPFFLLLKAPFSSPQSPCFVLLKVQFSTSRKPCFHPLPSSQSPLQSSPFSSESRFVLSPPLPPRIRKQRNDTKPSRRSRLVWSVPKWNMILSLEDLPNNPLNNVENSCHSTT